MPVLVQYKIIDGFNEYNDYLIHQDDVDVRDDEENCLTVKERSE